MNDFSDEANDRELRLSKVLDEYLDQLRAGQAPEVNEWMARYPDLAGDLHECLSCLDFIRQAAQAALAVGRPVKLTWSRAEDLMHDYYRPPAATSIEIGWDAADQVVSWSQRKVRGNESKHH